MLAICLKKTPVKDTPLSVIINLGTPKHDMILRMKTFAVKKAQKQTTKKQKQTKTQQKLFLLSWGYPLSYVEHDSPNICNNRYSVILSQDIVMLSTYRLEYLYTSDIYRQCL